MRHTTILAATLVAATLVAPLATAQDAKKGPFTDEIVARKSVMQVSKYNIGILGAMAKGKLPYDAKLASDAAYNLHLVALLQNGALWPKGSDVSNKELTEKTTAKAEMWTTYPKVAEQAKVQTEAAEALSKVAGNGLEAMRTALGPVGKGCKGCHDDFRVKAK